MAQALRVVSKATAGGSFSISTTTDFAAASAGFPEELSDEIA